MVKNTDTQVALSVGHYTRDLKSKLRRGACFACRRLTETGRDEPALRRRRIKAMQNAAPISPQVESVRIRDPCPFRAGVGESTQKIDRSDSFAEMIRLISALVNGPPVESERTGCGGAKTVQKKKRSQRPAC